MTIQEINFILCPEIHHVDLFQSQIQYQRDMLGCSKLILFLNLCGVSDYTLAFVTCVWYFKIIYIIC